jgi:RNA polymerase sigma-70 factor (ECF subfamily)
MASNLEYPWKMPTEASLRELFLAKVEDDLRPVFTDWTDLEQEIQLALASARSEWPSLQVSDSDFVAYLAERSLCEGDDPELPVFAADLYLACACLARNDSALQEFEDKVLSSANPILIKLGLSQDDADDIRQELRERLLLGLGDRQPGLASYLGTGAIKHWMRAVAGRQALASLRQKKPTTRFSPPSRRSTGKTSRTRYTSPWKGWKRASEPSCAP